ncbi:MAG: YolD-like family protein [Bacillales bacterium]|jgi:hypothetical protein|nr:YolD-like family protein [Bacillales bacterium]
MEGDRRMEDRGLMKWAAFMMPEHNTMLRNWKKEDEYEERIFLSDEQMEELSDCLIAAISSGKQVWLKHYVEKFKFYQKIQCRIVSCDPIFQIIRMNVLENGDAQVILMKDIIHIENV